MTQPDAILFFAAGFGTRMRPLTNTRPKPLIEVAGKPLLQHAIDQTKGMTLKTKVVNAFYLADQIADFAAQTGLVVSREGPDILDTGGGLKQAQPMLGDGPVFTMNTDAVWTGPSPLQHLSENWSPLQMGALLLCIRAERATGYTGDGDFDIDANGRLTRGGPFVFTGAQIIDGTLVTAHPDTTFSLNVIWSALATQGRLFGAVFSGGWCDVGHPGGIPLAEQMLVEAT